MERRRQTDRGSLHLEVQMVVRRRNSVQGYQIIGELILEPAGFKWETQVDSQEEHRKKRDKKTSNSKPTSDLRRDRTIESPYRYEWPGRES